MGSFSGDDSRSEYKVGRCQPCPLLINVRSKDCKRLLYFFKIFSAFRSRRDFGNGSMPNTLVTRCILFFALGGRSAVQRHETEQQPILDRRDIFLKSICKRMQSSMHNIPMNNTSLVSI